MNGHCQSLNHYLRPGSPTIRSIPLGGFQFVTQEIEDRIHFIASRKNLHFLPPPRFQNDLTHLEPLFHPIHTPRATITKSWIFKGSPYQWNNKKWNQRYFYGACQWYHVPKMKKNWEREKKKVRENLLDQESQKNQPIKLRNGMKPVSY